ncbi:hypothetical protein EV356DRAFT_468184 [Viridothelium virens]|uniref:Rhodopsin domain-containing protein n=1 Tax=Viridothelium virens TaxID=1048519 RepID=A0A6A6H6A8_VIRVR|nr:hypothetical protein EV356DRAFT_468184 [Viridothelium virens]
MDLYQQYHAYGGRGPTCVRTGLSLAVLATILIILRIYVRLRINNLGTTALLWAIAAWGLTVVTQVFGVLAALHGLGNHMTVLLETGEAHNFLKFTWLTVFFFCIAIATGKAAVAVFLIEITGLAYPKIRYTLIFLAAANFLISIPIAIYSQFHCSPVSAIWDPLRQDQCNARAYVLLSYVIGSVAALSDLVLALLPTYVLWSLQIDRRLKQLLCVLLGLGVIASIAAIVRTWASGFLEGADASYHLGILFTWGEVEEWLVIIAMSVPPTWPLFKPFCQRFAHIVSRSSSHLSSGKHYENKGDGASTDNVLRIRQERGFELTSEHRLSRDMKRTSYLEIEEDE